MDNMFFDIDINNLPKHIAIIMDGNGRWAKKRFLPRTAGHKAGVETVRKVITECKRLGIKHVIYFFYRKLEKTSTRSRNSNDIITKLFEKRSRRIKYK